VAGAGRDAKLAGGQLRSRDPSEPPPGRRAEHRIRSGADLDREAARRFENQHGAGWKLHSRAVGERPFEGRHLRQRDGVAVHLRRAGTRDLRHVPARAAIDQQTGHDEDSGHRRKQETRPAGPPRLGRGGRRDR
jgi:hypothetical protein